MVKNYLSESHLTLKIVMYIWKPTENLMKSFPPLLMVI